MDPEQKYFLSLPRLPARVNPERAAWYLGFQPHDIPVLVAAGLLKPLGNPPANGQKFFASFVLQELGQDLKWMNRACDAIYRYWRDKNRRKRQPCPPEQWQSMAPANTAA